MDWFDKEVEKLDENDPNLIEKWENLIDKFWKHEADQEAQVKHMKQCVALIGDL